MPSCWLERVVVEQCHRMRKSIPCVPMLIILYSICSALCPSSESKKSCSLPSGPINGFLNHPGDIIIGGTFLVHVNRIQSQPQFTTRPLDIKCQTFGVDYYESMHAFIFAIEEINSDPEFFPNVTLGFQIFDTCTVLKRAAQGTLWMLSGGQEMTPNYRCQNENSLAGVIGDSGSTKSILMGQILGLYRYPQISYLSTSPQLSNRDQFPSFFRTIPSDEFQAVGLAQLISYFGWSWVGLLASDNDYGQYGIHVLKQELLRTGACVAFIEDIMTGQPNRNAPHLAQIISKSTANVVVIICSDSDVLIVMEEFLRQNVTGKVWVASEAWATSALLSVKKFQKILRGTIGFAIRSGQISGFKEYFQNLSPSRRVDDSFIREYWELVFSCKWPNLETPIRSVVNGSGVWCTGMENLDNTVLKTDFRLSLNVYTSIYALAWALRLLKDCEFGKGPFGYGECANISSYHPWQLLYYVKHVQFETKEGMKIYFDKNGNPPAIYDIVNWRMTSMGTLEQVVVGSYDLTDSEEKTLGVNKSEITWATGDWQVPLSKCTPSCPLGFQKVILPGKPTCCFECVLCSQGEISNQTDAGMCHHCSWDTWPNLQQDRCLPKTIDYLSYEDILGIGLAAVAILSSIFPLGILGIFIINRSTPIVRANNRSLSCLLLISLSHCFICSLAFIGYPQRAKCLLRQVAFGMIFSLCIACILAKTITVVIAFTATKPGSRLKKLTVVKVSYHLIVFCICIQLCICFFWLFFSPPFTEYDLKTQPEIIVANCNEGSASAFWCMLGYLGLLATISFIVAFMARRLPDSFNEAKYITFSMLAFLSVWVSFIPAYLSAHGKYMVAMEVFAILSSSWALVICIFIPKSYIILFKPKMNSREHIIRKDRSGKI